MIDDVLDLSQVFLAHLGGMREVEAKSPGADVTAALAHVLPKHLAQRVLQQVSGGVIACGCHAHRPVHAAEHRIASLQGSALHSPNVQVKALFLVDVHEFEPGLPLICDDPSAVAGLSAGLGVSGGAVEHYGGLPPLLEGGDQLVAAYDSNNLCDTLQCPVAGELSGLRLALETVQGATDEHAALETRGAFRQGLMRRHFLEESLHVHAHLLLGEDGLRHLQREAIGLVEVERLLAAQHGAALALQVGHVSLEHLRAAIDRLLERLLLLPDHSLDVGAAFLQLRVGFIVRTDHGTNQLCHKWTFDAELVGIPHGSAQQTAHHVATFLIAWHHTVRDAEHYGPDVVGNAAQLRGGFRISPCARAADAFDLRQERLEQVNVEVRLPALQDAGHAFKTHPGVNVALWQRLEYFAFLTIVLLEDQVPDLDVAAAIAGRIARGLAAATAQVNVNLAAGPARAVGPLGARVGRPEVLPIPETEDTLRRQAGHFLPNLVRLPIVFKDAYHHVLGGDAHLAAHELPCPFDGLRLEVIAERKIAQHLEEGVMRRRPPHLLNVAGAEAFLARDGALQRRVAVAVELVLELVHSRAGEQQGGVVAGHKRVRGQHGVSQFAEELQEPATNLICFHGNHAR